MSKRRIFGGSNPMFKESAIERKERNISYSGVERMTVNGTVNKTTMLVGIVLIAAVYSFNNPSNLLMIGGMIAGVVTALITNFKPHIANITAPIYSAFEGLFVGSFTVFIAHRFGGLENAEIIKQIAMPAISGTICVLLVMLLLYRSGTIKVTEKLRSGVMMATGAIMMVYLLSWILGMFSINIPYLHEGGPIGIGISVLIIGVASFKLLVDFDNVVRGEEGGRPKYMEWFMGMGLVMTLVWLYYEIAMLLSMLARD